MNPNQNNNRGNGGNKRNVTAIVSVLLWALVLTLLVNVATQLLLTGGLQLLFRSPGLLLLGFLPLEILILVAEALLYRRLFTADTRDRAARLRAIAERLPEPYREVFRLRAFGELPYKDIGRQNGKTANWACVTFHRAREMIRRRWEEEEG